MTCIKILTSIYVLFIKTDFNHRANYWNYHYVYNQLESITAQIFIVRQIIIRFLCLPNGYSSLLDGGKQARDSIKDQKTGENYKRNVDFDHESVFIVPR